MPLESIQICLNILTVCDLLVSENSLKFKEAAKNPMIEEDEQANDAIYN